MPSIRFDLFFGKINRRLLRSSQVPRHEGKRAAAGMGLPMAKVIKKLTTGERSPRRAPTKRLKDRRRAGREDTWQPLYSPAEPAHMCTSCGKRTANATTPADIRLLIVIFAFNETFFFTKIDSIIFFPLNIMQQPLFPVRDGWICAADRQPRTCRNGYNQPPATCRDLPRASFPATRRALVSIHRQIIHRRESA